VKLVTDNSWLKWTLLAAVALSSEYGAGQTAVLLREAAVSRDTIRLSDLLPPEAPKEMRRAGEQIELGRTPQCRTIRVFEKVELERRTSSWPALRGLSLSGPAAVQRTCFPIRREAVQRVISEFAQQKGLALMEFPLRWSEVIYASQQNPAIEIEQTLPEPARPVLQVRLRCVERMVCPSFWVPVPAKLRPRLLYTGTISAASVVPKIGNGEPLVKSGQRVMLIFDDPPLRIQLLVTCLQRGSLGEQVRAMDPSTHRVFEAEVTGAGTLLAHL
jgi:hypothetical protein